MDPSGIFPTSYRADRRLVRTRWQAVCLALFLVVMLAMPYLVSGRIIAVLNMMLISAVIAVGLQICTGYAGQINLGQAAFMGVGAYTASILASKTGLTFLLTIPLAGFAAALFGFLFGLTATRIKGFYLALTTLAAQFIFHFAVLNLPSSWLGGSNGVTVPAAEIFGLRFVTETQQFYMNLAVAAIMIAGAFGIIRSRFGRAFIAVRDDDVAMIIVGGMGSIVGALVGVFVIRTIQEVIATVGPNIADSVSFLGGDIVFAGMNVILGGVIALFMILEPKGVMHRWNILKSSYRIWPFPY